jgi:dihydropteroate synthase-like protein
MVLSVNPDNVDQLLDLPKDLVLVVIPVSFKNRNRNYNLIESNPITILNDLSQKLIHAGFTKILLDPLTDAPIVPGILPSIENLIQLQKSISETFDSEKLKHLMCKPQLFMGIGNVTELMDADSPGINAFLAILAVEMSISAILSTEYSQKNRKGLEELRQGINLAFRAKTLHVPPINIGISALRLKSKSPYPKYLKFGEPIDKVTAEETPAEMDPLGYFKMGVDLENNHIWITHYTNRQDKRDVTHTFTGTSAESLYKRIITEKLVSRLDHAAYLGKELMRAELALKYGTEYREN